MLSHRSMTPHHEQWISPSGDSGQMNAPPVTRRRLVPVLTYATIFIVAAVGLVIVLPRGNAIVPAPQAAAVGTVDAPGADCLGERLATVQSGVFLDYYVAGTHGDATEDLGDHIMGGRIEAETGSWRPTGNLCPRSTAGRTGALVRRRRCSKTAL